VGEEEKAVEKNDVHESGKGNGRQHLDYRAQLFKAIDVLQAGFQRGTDGWNDFEALKQSASQATTDREAFLMLQTLREALNTEGELNSDCSFTVRNKDGSLSKYTSLEQLLETQKHGHSQHSVRSE
jgi:hypothetical protein